MVLKALKTCCTLCQNGSGHHEAQVVKIRKVLRHTPFRSILFCIASPPAAHCPFDAANICIVNPVFVESFKSASRGARLARETLA